MAGAAGRTDPARADVPDNSSLSRQHYIRCLGCLRFGLLGWQGDEPTADLICLGDLQRLTKLQGLLPRRLGLPVLGDGSQGLGEVPERFDLTMAVAQLAAQGEALAQAGDRLRELPELSEGGAEALQDVSLEGAVTELAEDAKGFLEAGDRVRKPPEPSLDDAQAVQVLGLVPTVAQRLAQGEALLQAGDRLRVPADLSVGLAEAGQAGGLVVAVARGAAQCEAFLQAGDRLGVVQAGLGRRRGG